MRCQRWCDCTHHYSPDIGDRDAKRYIKADKGLLVLCRINPPPILYWNPFKAKLHLNRQSSHPASKCNFILRFSLAFSSSKESYPPEDQPAVEAPPSLAWVHASPVKFRGKRSLAVSRRIGYEMMMY
ncbi:hypothetical protein PGT21_008205 [Puccinia graminis f. sp. tritici]|uniref:Uncharacterized protein n=1 Tax=Puccinia graminis f. sp. tritici TaxID=56615 RepID=A0A5B0RIN4_PUCGR|nr:hypothetical protein PGT21_008205 [Puccinia graminis f. sp. tritici]KAA1125239.1 hypothetical protein PGTUg99_011288 [Puccinia graminis f. sp. tritici]